MSQDDTLRIWGFKINCPFIDLQKEKYDLINKWRSAVRVDVNHKTFEVIYEEVKYVMTIEWVEAMVTEMVAELVAELVTELVTEFVTAAWH